MCATQLASGFVCLLAPVVWWYSQLADSKATRGVGFFNYDQYHYTVPAFRYAADELRHGRLPLWVPQQLCGGPFLATQLHGILYPPHWLILWLPLAVVWKVLLVGHAIVAMGGAFACARLFGTRRPAALLAGITYAFSGTVTLASTFSMKPAMVSVAWLPWQIAFTRAVLRAESGWLLPALGLGVVTAFCIVGGHLPCLPIAAVMCGLYAALHLGWHVWRCGLLSAGARAGRLFVAAVVAVGLSAAQLLPTLELLARSPRTGAFYSAQAADWFPLTPGELLLGLVNSLPNYFGFPSGLFVGTAALGLALIPFIDHKFRRSALALWILGARDHDRSGHPHPRFWLVLPSPGIVDPAPPALHHGYGSEPCPSVRAGCRFTVPGTQHGYRFRRPAAHGCGATGTDLGGPGESPPTGAKHVRRLGAHTQPRAVAGVPGRAGSAAMELVSPLATARSRSGWGWTGRLRAVQLDGAQDRHPGDAPERAGGADRGGRLHPPAGEFGARGHTHPYRARAGHASGSRAAGSPGEPANDFRLRAAGRSALC
jgi:hypothetical protein